MPGMKGMPPVVLKAGSSYSVTFRRTFELLDQIPSLSGHWMCCKLSAHGTLTIKLKTLPKTSSRDLLPFFQNNHKNTDTRRRPLGINKLSNNGPIKYFNHIISPRNPTQTDASFTTFSLTRKLLLPLLLIHNSPARRVHTTATFTLQRTSID